jgi:catecholate siderophore receptor
MPHRTNHKSNTKQTPSSPAHIATKVIAPSSAAPRALIPIGAMLLAGSLSAAAQEPPADTHKTLSTVVITEKAEAPQGKDAYRATGTSIGKGKQQLRDIPQSVTVVTEKLVDDRTWTP